MQHIGMIVQMMNEQDLQVIRQQKLWLISIIMKCDYEIIKIDQ